MIDLHADEKLLMKELGLFIEPVMVHDAQGHLLGLFVPANMEQCKEKQAIALAQIDWEVIEKRRRDMCPGEPLEETWGRINKLELEMERRKAAGERPFTNDEALAFFRAMRHEADNGNGTQAHAGEGREANACATP